MEFLYTQFVNLITSEPSIRTVLPLKAQGIEDQADEIFTLTTEDGKLAAETTVRSVPVRLRLHLTLPAGKHLGRHGIAWSRMMNHD